MIATVGRSPFFAEAVASALREKPHEVLVVQDGASVDREQAAGARLLTVDGLGRSAARNAGVEEAETPYVAFLDDDDLVLPGRIRRQREVLDTATGSALTFGRITVVDADGRGIARWNELLNRRFDRVAASNLDAAAILASNAPIYTSATLVRRDDFLSIDGYDRGLDAYEDLDLYLRLAGLGPVVPTPGEAVAVYRLHGSNTPSDRLYEGLLAVAAKHLPVASGRTRRLLIERKVDALWGLRRFGDARREAVRAARTEPRLLVHPRFARRLAGSLIPRRPRAPSR